MTMQKSPEARRTFITQLVLSGIYRPKDILVELDKRDMKISRSQLYKDMQTLAIEQDEDFREHRERYRAIAFNKLLRRERDAARSIDDLTAREDENYRRFNLYRTTYKAAQELGEKLPEEPKELEINYSAKAKMIASSISAIKEASALAGIATSIVAEEAGDLASWAAVARDGGMEAFEKRRAQVFPEYAKAIRKLDTVRAGTGA